MHTEITIPFTWDGWDKNDILCNQYYNVEFTEDFGTFKKGEKFNNLSVDYGAGRIQTWNDEGSVVIKQQYYKAIPIDFEL